MKRPSHGGYGSETVKNITAKCNGHSPTDTSARSVVTVMKRPWPLAKGNGFILVSEWLPGTVLSLFLLSELQAGSAMSDNRLELKRRQTESRHKDFLSFYTTLRPVILHPAALPVIYPLALVAIIS